MATINVTLNFTLSTKNPSDQRLLAYSMPVFTGTLVIEQTYNSFEIPINLDVGATGRRFFSVDVDFDENESGNIDFSYSVPNLNIDVDGFYPFETGISKADVTLYKNRKDNNFIIDIQRTLTSKPLAVVRKNLIQQIVTEAEVKENEIKDVKNIIDEITRICEKKAGKKMTYKKVPEYLATVFSEESQPITPSLESVLKIKGSVNTFAELPESDNEAGDVWNVVKANGNIPAGTNYVWTGTDWDALGGSVDLNKALESLKCPIEPSSFFDGIENI